MRNAFVIIVLFFALVVTASAQVPMGGNLFAGYSYTSLGLNGSQRSGLNGWNASLEGKVFPFVGMVADISAQYGTQDNAAPCVGSIGQACPGPSINTDLRNYLFGPRVSFSVGRFRPFAEALFGASHISESAGPFFASDTSFATGFGGGIDYRLFMLLGWRVEVDALQTRFFNSTQNNLRVSTGLVLRF